MQATDRCRRRNFEMREWTGTDPLQEALEQPMHAYLANKARDISHSLLQANRHGKRNRSDSTNTPAES